MNKNSFFLILMFVAMVFWGSSWPSSKILIEYTSAPVITFWRFFFALLASIPLVLFLKISLRIGPRDLKFLLLAAVFNSFYSIAYFIALHYGSAGKGGVLVTTMTPIFTYLLFFIVRKFKKDNEKIASKTEILGLILGVISGVCLLKLGSFSNLFGTFNLLFLFCALDWAVLTLIMHRVRIHPIAINFYITLFSVIYWLPLFFFENTMLDIFDFEIRFWMMLCLVAVLSTAIGTSVFYIGVMRLGAIKASTFTLLIPATALITSYFILGEKPDILTIFGGTLAVFAIYLINLYKPTHLKFFKKNKGI